MEPENNGFVTLYNERIVNASVINAQEISCESLDVDTINEYTNGHGVEIDGLTVKDGQITDTTYIAGILQSDADGVISSSFTVPGSVTVNELYSNGLVNGTTLRAVYDVRTNRISDYGNNPFYYITLDGTTQKYQFYARAGFLNPVEMYERQSGTLSITTPGIYVSNCSTGVVHSDTNGKYTSSLIVNADVDNSASITYGKLNLTDSIMDADINTYANISDYKLGTISTAGKVSNSATTATSSSTANAIVARDSSGNFSANDITANNFLGSVTYATTAGYATSAGTAGFATNADNIYVTDTTTSASTHYLTFTSTSAGNTGIKTDSTGLTYQPSTNTITASLNGNASTATTATTATSATNSTNSTNISITDTTSAGTYYPLFASSTSGNQLARTHGATLKYYPGSNALECANFTGVASKSSDIYLVDDTTSANTHYILFSLGSSGYIGAKCDSTGLTYQPSTNTITASLNGNASSATNATNVNITDVTSGATHYLTFVSSVSGNNDVRVDSTGLTYNPTSNTLTTTTFAGQLNGTINTATTATTQTASTNNTTVATTAFANTAVSNVFTTLPITLYTNGGYIVTGAVSGQYRVISPGEVMRTGLANVAAIVGDITGSYPTIPGKTAKMRTRYTVINNNVANPFGVGGSIDVILYSLTGVNGATTNIGYNSLGTGYGTVNFAMSTANNIQRSTSATFNALSAGSYIFVVETNATLTGNVSVSCILELIYE